MIVLYLFVLGLFVYLYIKGREFNHEEASGKEKPLEVIAYYLFNLKKIYQSKNNTTVKRVVEELQNLQPTENSRELEKKYYVEKIKLCLTVIIVGNLFALGLYASNMMNGYLEEGGQISRNLYGQGQKIVDLIASFQDEEEKEDMEIHLSEKSFEKEELEKLYQKLIENMETIILGENLSVDEISKNMNLPEEILDYPFTIQWETSDYSLLDTYGEIGTRNPIEGGELVQLTATISYEKWVQTYLFYVTRVVPNVSSEEERRNTLLEMLKEEDDKTKEESYFILPTHIGGEAIEWEEKKIENSYIIVALTLVAVIGIVIGKDKELQKETLKRKKEMLRDYPEIVSKLLLLLSAGMTIRGAFDKMAIDYIDIREKAVKKFAYEEIMIMHYEMQSGVWEIQAYENFGRRCNEPHYMKLSALLAQNSKKGASRLVEVLRSQVANAFEERKNNVRQEGEEASTKLLLPMMLMLLIVMIVIIVPAFMSFGI